MIRNIIIAILLGILVGFGLTSGFFKLKGQNMLKPVASTTPTPTIIENATNNQTDQIISKTTSENIIINSPKDEEIVNKSVVTLTGQAPANSNIVIRSPINTYFTTSNSAGVFTQDIDLEPGANKIFISAIDSQDQQFDLEIYLTYSTSKI